MLKRRVSRRLQFGSVVTFLALVTVGLSTSAVASAGSSSTKLVVTATGETLDLPGQVDALGFGTYGSIYGGVTVGSDGTSVTVYLTQPTSDVENAFDALAPAGTISFATTPNSQNYLASIQSAVLNDYASLGSQGTKIVKIWPSVQTGLEEIGVENLTTEETTTLESTFGASNISVFNVTAAHVPVLTSTRTDDTSPFNGGDSIYHASPGDGCSTGFGIVIGGTSDLLTAGHCYSDGDQIYNALCTAADCSTTTGSGVSLGPISERSYASLMGDSEVINALGSYLIWRGAIGSPSAASVAGYTNNPIGDQVCQSGSYSGELCDIRIVANNVCIPTPDGFMVCHNTYAQRSDGIANELGDSGGPVYRFISGGLYATGTVSGSTDRAPTCTANDFSWEKCYTDLDYTDIDWTLDHWGASMETS